MKSDDSAKGNVKYFQSLSYRNIKDSDSLENCVEICAHKLIETQSQTSNKLQTFWAKNILYVSLKIFDALRDLIPFVQFKNVKNTHRGLLLLVMHGNIIT